MITVSSYRIVVGDETVLMSNLRSASVYTHVEPNIEAEGKRTRAKAKANIRLVGGLCVLVLSLAAFLLILEWYQIILLVLLGCVPGVVLLLSGLRRLRLLVHQEVRPIQSYCLRIETHTGPSDMLIATDKKELDQVVQAISKALG